MLYPLSYEGAVDQCTGTEVHPRGWTLRPGYPTIVTRVRWCRSSSGGNGHSNVPWFRVAVEPSDGPTRSAVESRV
jgi:hypothetical protein